MRFDELTAGDRFLSLDALWTKLGSETARKHSRTSRALGQDGWGYHGDAVCSFEPNDFVVFVPPGVGDADSASVAAEASVLAAVREYLKALDGYKAVMAPSGRKYDALMNAEDRLRAIVGAGS